MTFELSADHLALRDQSRAVAAAVIDRAADIDRTGEIPDDIGREAAAVCGSDPLGLVVAVEELATASAAVAIGSARGPGHGERFGLTGLRGAPVLDESPRSQLVLAATALGIARSALGRALDQVRRSTAVAGGDVEKPHWVVADAATDVEAARLLTYKAAKTTAEADIAMARLMASLAAQRAVDAAIRVEGPAALTAGSALERLARDVRAVAVILGTEERQRATAAEGLLPQ